MKTIGMLGGMSWESTVKYYEMVNEQVKERLGGLHSARICLYSVDFSEIETLQHQGRWDDTADILSRAAAGLESAGADFLVICTNTMHKVAPQIESAISIPLLHIADATAAQLMSDGVNRVGLLGTRFTMEQAFYRQRMSDLFGIEVMIPDEASRSVVHRVIYDELCKGEVSPDSRMAYLDIIEEMHRKGAQAVILGCTEISMLVTQADTHVPLYDTTAIHADAAVEFALVDESLDQLEHGAR